MTNYFKKYLKYKKKYFELKKKLIGGVIFTYEYYMKKKDMVNRKIVLLKRELKNKNKNNKIYDKDEIKLTKLSLEEILYELEGYRIVYNEQKKEINKLKNEIYNLPVNSPILNKKIYDLTDLLQNNSMLFVLISLTTHHILYSEITFIKDINSITREIENNLINKKYFTVKQLDNIYLSFNQIYKYIDNIYKNIIKNINNFNLLIKQDLLDDIVKTYDEGSTNLIAKYEALIMNNDMFNNYPLFIRKKLTLLDEITKLEIEINNISKETTDKKLLEDVKTNLKKIEQISNNEQKKETLKKNILDKYRDDLNKIKNENEEKKQLLNNKLIETKSTNLTKIANLDNEFQKVEEYIYEELPYTNLINNFPNNITELFLIDTALLKLLESTNLIEETNIIEKKRESKLKAIEKTNTKANANLKPSAARTIDEEFESDENVLENSNQTIHREFENDINNLIRFEHITEHTPPVLSKEEEETFNLVTYPKRKNLITLLNFDKIIDKKDSIVKYINDYLIENNYPTDIFINDKVNYNNSNFVISFYNSQDDYNSFAHFTFHKRNLDTNDYKYDPVGPYHFKIDDGTQRFFNLELDKKNNIYIENSDEIRDNENIYLITKAIEYALNKILTE